jgi:aryl-alcohol dehydrogenase-like predicted oxidoreductase
MLHNPDSIGYTSEVVWSGMERLRNMGMTNLLGVAPGPANGFALDIIGCFEKYGDSIDWIMLILNPLEPWPMNEVLPAAFKYDVSAMARVVECGGLFHDDVKPGHVFSTKDHRKHRPVGWLEVGQEKMERMRHIARRHGLTMLQLACQWTMQQPCVESIVPTLTEEVSDSCKSIQHKLTELLSLGEGEMLSPEEIKEIDEIGDNRNCLPFSQRFKGATPGYQGAVQADRWELSDGLWEVAQRWGFDLDSLKSSMQFAD